jgi:osmotically-inducible protein OsmY
MAAALAAPLAASAETNPGARTTGTYSSGDTPGTTRSDLVTSNVRAELAGDRALKGSTIHVSTSDEGVVLLSGSVPSVTAQREAVELTSSIPGVAVVNNQLRLVIASPQAPTPN